MAKRKKSKETNKPGMSIELTGLILAIVGIIGFGFGYVGTLIKEFGMFLLGSWWIVFDIYLLLVGLFMVFKRKMPKFFSSRLIGFYLIMIVILVASHFTFLNKIENPVDIIKITFDQFMDRIHTINMANSVLDTGNTTIAIGGGIIGAVFISGLYFLFARTGTIIVLVIAGIVGVVLLLDLTMSEALDKIRNFVKNNKALSDEDEEDDGPTLADVSEEVVKEIPAQEKKNDKIVINSLADIKNKMTDVKEVIPVEPVVVEDEAFWPYQLLLVYPLSFYLK